MPRGEGVARGRAVGDLDALAEAPEVVVDDVAAAQGLDADLVVRAGAAVAVAAVAAGAGEVAAGGIGQRQRRP